MPVGIHGSASHFWKIATAHFQVKKITRQNNIRSKYIWYIFSGWDLDVGIYQGPTKNEGNLFARNKNTGRFGPVCADEWDMSDVGRK